MFVLKIVGEILKVSHLFSTRKASSCLRKHTARLNTANGESRLLHNFCADKKIWGCTFFSPQMHVLCLLILKLRGKVHACWLEIHSEAARQVKSGERFISRANLLRNYSCVVLETKVIPGKFSLSQIIWVQESMKLRVFSERKGCNGKGKLASERSLGWFQMSSMWRQIRRSRVHRHVCLFRRSLGVGV